MSIEPRTTRYTIKANVETTRYFNSPYPDIEEQVNENTNDITNLTTQINLKENITDHNTDISNINSSISNLQQQITQNKNDIYHVEQDVYVNTSDITTLQTQMSSTEGRLTTAEGKITTNTNDISNLKTRLTTAEGNITTNTNDISNLKSQIASISNNPYEGLYYPVYNSNSGRAIIVFNYDKGKLMFWPINASTWSGALNNGEYTLNADVEEITIPGTIKKINQDGTTNKIINKINYMIAGDNTLLSNLKTLTTMPDVYSLSINLTKAPKLCNFNLMNGLEVLKIEGLGSTSQTDPIIGLTIPSSVMECELKNINFRELTFESGDNEYSNALKLTYTNCQVRNKLTCKRDLKYNSSINANDSNIWAPNVLECTGSFLYYLSNSDSLGCAVIGSNTMNTTKTTLLLYYSILFDEPGTTWPGITFKSIFNYTYKSKSSFTNILYTSNWYPNA